MLRRVANQLFWAARNLERAEWRARLVDVNYHLLIETPPRDSAPWEPLLAISGDREDFAKRYDVADERAVLNFFTFDRDNPNSIRSCINVARENIRSLRHHVSSEFWLDLNSLYIAAQEWTPELFDSPGVYAFFSDLKDSFYRVSGIRQSTFSRDLAYDFMRLGIMLERAEDVSRMLDVKYHFLLPRLEDVGGAVDRMQWVAVLRSASALEAYRKRFGSALRVDHVLDFLLFDASFPRSARYAIEQLQVSLERIGGKSPEPAPVPRGVRALLGELSANSGAQSIERGLHQFLLHIQHLCDEIFAQIYQQYLVTD